MTAEALRARTWQLLDILADGRFHSGEALAQRLGVSRASVFNALADTAGCGVAVQRVRGRGYRLGRPWQPLRRDDILRWLDADGGSFDIEVMPQAASSNTLLLQRAALGAPRLHAAAQLGAAAERKAQDMASRGYFAHSAPYGKDPWAWLREAGYEYRYAGENLAVRFVDSRDVIDAWMSSPSHRANITKAQYSEIGVGVAQGFYNGEPATYVVQYFGAPSAAADGGWSLPQDEGAAVVQSQPLTDSVLRQLVRIAAEPRESAALALGTVATALTLLVAAAFLHKIEFQPSPMLFSGALVAFIALALYGFNSALLAPGDTNSVETASALDSLRVRKVIIDKGISEIAPDFMRVYRFNI